MLSYFHLTHVLAKYEYFKLSKEKTIVQAPLYFSPIKIIIIYFEHLCTTCYSECSMRINSFNL